MTNLQLMFQAADRDVEDFAELSKGIDRTGVDTKLDIYVEGLGDLSTNMANYNSQVDALLEEHYQGEVLDENEASLCNWLYQLQKLIYRLQSWQMA